MAFSYGFFNAKNMDRVYTAEDFTGYLSSIICNGIFDTYGDCFSVTATDGLSVQIGTGKAWINGHYFTSDSAYTLDLSKYVDESLSRYVTIGIDFVTGVVTAVMGKSKHSDSGALNSKAGWIGLAKKFCILLMVMVGVRIDILVGTNYIRDTVCISFCLNELLSIVENASLMGIPYVRPDRTFLIA